MRHATLFHYKMPMASGVILRKKSLTTREGFFIRLQQGCREGWGEISPLPTFSRENIDECLAQLKICLRKWQIGEEIKTADLAPSVAFGISFALAELNEQLQLTENRLHCVLCSDETKAQTFLKQPQQTAKIKVGRENPRKEGEKVRDYLQRYPQLKLRLDANQAWDLKQALTFAVQIPKPQRIQIEFIEEPCQTISDSLAFAEETEIALAWDESTRERDFQLQPAPFLRAIVIKPTLLGSFEDCVTLLNRAQQFNLDCVISSSLESSLALNQLARFAQQFAPQTIPGLDTLDLSGIQLIRPTQQSHYPLFGLNSRYIRRIPF